MADSAGDPGNEVRSDDLAASLAILKVNYDQGRSHLDTFLPFLVEVLREGATEVLSAVELQHQIWVEFSISMPVGVVDALLARSEQLGYIKRADSVYKRLGSLKPDGRFRRDRREAAAHIVALATKLANYAGANYQEHWSVTDAERRLIQHVNARLGDFLPLASGESLAADSSGFGDAYIINRFLTDTVQTDPIGLEGLETLVKGAAIASTMYLPDGVDSGPKLTDLTFYLDTEIVLNVMGLHGTVAQSVTNDLVDLMGRSDGKVVVLRDTRSEVRRVVRGVINAFRNEGADTQPYGPVAEAARKAGRSASDLEVALGDLDNELHLAGILVVESDKDYEEDARVTGMARSELGGINYLHTQAFNHDVWVLTYLAHLRREHAGDALRSSGAILVTDNWKVAAGSGRLLLALDMPAQVPLAIPQTQLSALLWLSAPTKAAALPHRALIADAYAGLVVPDTLWGRYVAEVQKLRDRDEISRDEWIAMRDPYVVADLLMEATRGETRAFTVGTVEEVREQALHAIRREAELKAAEEEVARVAAEGEAGALRSSLEAGRRERYQRYDRTARRFGRGVGLVFFGVLCIIAFTGFLWSAGIVTPDSTSQPGPLVTIGSLAVMGFGFLGFVDLTTGRHLLGWREWVEAKATRWAQPRIARMFEGNSDGGDEAGTRLR